MKNLRVGVLGALSFFFSFSAGVHAENNVDHDPCELVFKLRYARACFSHWVEQNLEDYEGKNSVGLTSREIAKQGLATILRESGSSERFVRYVLNADYVGVAMQHMSEDVITYYTLRNGEDVSPMPLVSFNMADLTTRFRNGATSLRSPDAWSLYLNQIEGWHYSDFEEIALDRGPAYEAVIRYPFRSTRGLESLRLHAYGEWISNSAFFAPGESDEGDARVVGMSFFKTEYVAFRASFLSWDELILSMIREEFGESLQRAYVQELEKNYRSIEPVTYYMNRKSPGNIDERRVSFQAFAQKAVETRGLKFYSGEIEVSGGGELTFIAAIDRRTREILIIGLGSSER